MGQWRTKLLPQTMTCDGRYDDNMKNTVVVSD